MGKHCDVAHIVDPVQRTNPLVQEENPRLNLSAQRASLAFDLMAAPNTKGHIVGPGEYRLTILIAAENARPKRQTISISVSGTWYVDETRMLRDEVGITIS